jgi:hypothetical protein
LFGWRFLSRTLHTIGTLKIVMVRKALLAVTGGVRASRRTRIHSPPGTVDPIAAADADSALVNDSDKKGETR